MDMPTFIGDLKWSHFGTFSKILLHILLDLKMDISRTNVISFVFNNEFNDLVESLITHEIFYKIFNELVAFNIRIICVAVYKEKRIIKKKNLSIHQVASFWN